MIFLAVFGPIIWPYNRLDLHPVTQSGGSPPGWLRSPFSLADPFGTDDGGRSVFVLTVNGARLSMLIGVGTTAIAVTIGVIVGSFAGFFGGRVDGLLMRFVDLMLTIPFLFVILVAARFFGAGDPIVLTLIFGLLFWPGLARLVRALFLSLREQDFVQAARAVGVSDIADHLPAHPAQRPRADHRLGHPPGGRGDRDRGLRELPELRAEGAGHQLGQRAVRTPRASRSWATGGGRSSRGWPSR